MSNLNTDLLIDNIHELMKKHGIKQIELAQGIGMSQPNLSKALNKNDKKAFTLEQIVDIASYFHVSVDSLIYGENSTQSHQYSMQEISRILSDLLEQHIALIQDVPREEILHRSDDLSNRYDPNIIDERITVTYPAIIFPEYWYPYDQDDQDGWQNIAYIGDNRCEIQSVNDFLRNYEGMDKARQNYSVTTHAVKKFIDVCISDMSDKILKGHKYLGKPV